MNPLDRAHPWFTGVSNGSDNRHPDAYEAVLKSFAFDTNPRYQPDANGTYCNVAAADAGFHLGAFVPHVWTSPGSSAWVEHTINQTIDWLNEGGIADYGWKKCDSADDALQGAALGLPTIVVWKNPAGHGHIAWVQHDGTLAQAGARSGYGFELRDVFTAEMVEQLEYLVHP